MKWFKHYSDACDGETINEIFLKFKHKGYAMYFIILEVLSDKDALYAPCETSLKYLSRKCRTTPQQVLTFCLTFPQLFSISVSEDNDKVKLFCPKLQQIKDNYKTDLEDTSKTLPRDFQALYKEKEKEKEKDKEKEGRGRAKTSSAPAHFSVPVLYYKSVFSKTHKREVMLTDFQIKDLDKIALQAGKYFNAMVDDFFGEGYESIKDFKDLQDDIYKVVIQK